MTAPSHGTCAGLLAVVLLTGTGCAALTAIDQGLERASRSLSFASWQHFLFSARMNGKAVTLRQPVATPTDAAVAAREGGWWGDPVPVAE